MTVNNDNNCFNTFMVIYSSGDPDEPTSRAQRLRATPVLERASDTPYLP